jgi:hypothetical protein
VNSQDPIYTEEHEEPDRSNVGGSLREIIEQLENDSEERWHAMEGLGLIEPEERVAIIAELSRHQQNSGTSSLLRLLCSARDLPTRSAARAALRIDAAIAPSVPWLNLPAHAHTASAGNEVELERIAAARQQVQDTVQLPADAGGWLIGCLVTPVDGGGCGSIAVSATQRGQRRTAAFLCDVQRGICDVVGDVEPEIPGAGRLIDELSEQVGEACVRNAPDLAIRLLAGCLMLGGVNVPSTVRDWLWGILGPDFRPVGFPASIPGSGSPSIASDEMPARALAVLDACPTWIDTSPLTCELARAIFLREGKVTADPDRNSGAYRYLFEHRLIHRLELYGRMLLWMAWFWRYWGETELSNTAQVLATQLYDEQYAVPAHPFTLALTTRSLEAAQAAMHLPSKSPASDAGA